MRVGSLFSGVGLGDLGLTLAGMEIVFQVEIEPYARKVLELRWPDVPKFGDIREVEGRLTPPCDILAGGFPCQDISTAGKGAGIGGERSGLWKEFARLIREIRPRYVLVENVTALLGRGLGVVLGDLAEIGYDAEWDCIPASALGAPHQRDRIWIVAYSRHRSGGDGERGSIGGNVEWKDEAAERSVETTSPSRSSEASRALADTNKKRLEGKRAKRGQEGRKDQGRPSGLRHGTGGGDRGSEIRNAASPGLQNRPAEKIFRPEALEEFKRSNRWPVEPAVGRVAHGVSSRVYRLKGLGNGQVVQVVQYIGERILAFDKGMK